MEGFVEVGPFNATYFVKDSVIFVKRIIFTTDQRTIERWYNQDGNIHREDLPAEICYYETGQKSEECWYKNGKIHRDGLPADIYYFKNGQKSEEHWYKDDKHHRKDLPAVICYHENGQEYDELWLEDGELHRLSGPAMGRDYFHNGKMATNEIGEWVSLLPKVVSTIKTLPYPIFMEIKDHLYKIHLYE